MAQKKGAGTQDLMMHVGIALILIGSSAVKSDISVFFLLGLGLLALHLFAGKVLADKKMVVTEIMLAATVVVGAITQLALASSFKAPQVFLVVVLLGAILVVVEALRA